MAAGDPITVTNTEVLKRNTGYSAAANAADQDTITLAQKFIVTPTRGDDKTVIRMTVAAANGDVSYSVKAGAFWMGIAALTGKALEGKTTLLTLETAKYLQKDGTIEITCTPVEGKKLKTDHALSVEVDSIV
jgi:alpha-D-ribose 1-methylphosphonate 5-triphosphate synthase subunit PhnL